LEYLARGGRGTRSAQSADRIAAGGRRALNVRGGGDYGRVRGIGVGPGVGVGRGGCGFTGESLF
jgi:hypothetical protein